MLTSCSSWGLEDGSILDHMIRMSISFYSPIVAIFCQTVCPEDLSCGRKRQQAVRICYQLRENQDTLAQDRDEEEGAEQQYQSSEAMRASREEVPRVGPLSPFLPGAQGSASAW
ncbi:hypothetical protein H1C71_031532 [Ictidomys tridecemlineatus]|nr:hypothetical protein H1C71_031532 [Ictidomys tridecemlineatus]